MKSFLKRHKEIVILIGAALLVGLVSHDLFSEQQQNSDMINSGTTLTPSNFSGRVSCEVPIPSIQPRTVPEEADAFREKTGSKKPEGKSASNSN